MRTKLGRGLGVLLLACAAVSLSHGASAQTLFVDEVVTDHTGHSHTFELIDEIVTGGTPFDLDLADLSFSDIEDSDFTGAILTDAILDNVYIRNSIFTGAFFNDASFEHAIVRAGNFDGADFSGTDLSNTQWSCIPDPDGDSSSAFPDLCPTFIAADFLGADLTSAYFGPKLRVTTSCSPPPTLVEPISPTPCSRASPSPAWHQFLRRPTGPACAGATNPNPQPTRWLPACRS